MSSCRKRLSDVADIVLGQTFRAKAETDDAKSGVKLLQIKDIKEGFFSDAGRLPFATSSSSSEKMILRDGDVVIPLRGSRYESAIIKFEDQEFPVITTNQVAIVRPKSLVVSGEFIIWFLNSNRGRLALSKVSSGTSISSINKASLEGLEIPVPEPKVQKKIVAIYFLWREQRGVLQELINNGDSLYESYGYSLAGI